MRISDWSSDVCSSDLQKAAPEPAILHRGGGAVLADFAFGDVVQQPLFAIDDIGALGPDQSDQTILVVELIDFQVGRDAPHHHFAHTQQATAGDRKSVV